MMYNSLGGAVVIEGGLPIDRRAVDMVVFALPNLAVRVHRIRLRESVERAPIAHQLVTAVGGARWNQS